MKVNVARYKARCFCFALMAVAEGGHPISMAAACLGLRIPSPSVTSRRWRAMSDPRLRATHTPSARARRRSAEPLAEANARWDAESWAPAPHRASAAAFSRPPR